MNTLDTFREAFEKTPLTALFTEEVPAIQSTKLVTLDLYKALAMILTGDVCGYSPYGETPSDISAQTERCRAAYRTWYDETDPEIKKALKRHYNDEKSYLPVVYFAGVFQGRNNLDIIQPSNYLMLDFDAKDQTASNGPVDLHDLNVLTRTKALIFTHTAVVAVFTAPSGAGIKALVRIEATDETDPQYQSAYYHQAHRQLESEFAEEFGLIADRSCCNIGRPTYIPHDPTLLCRNPMDVKPIRVSRTAVKNSLKVAATESRQQTKTTAQVLTAGTSGDATSPEKLRMVQELHDACARANVSISASYQDWIMVGTILKRELGEHEGLTWFDAFSKMDRAYQADEVLRKYQELPVGQCDSPLTLRSLIWMAHQQGVSAFNNLPIVERFEIWFQAQYIIKMNELDKALYWRRRDSDRLNRFLWEYEPSKLARLAEKELDVKIPDQVVDRTLRFLGVQESFNPITEYITGLSWDGIDRLTPLIQSIKTDDDDLFAIHFRKWFVNLVATALGCVKNEQVLVFTGSQYCGKTWFLENLLPTIPHWKLTEKSSNFDPNNKDHKHLGATRMLVIFDEMSTYSKQNLAELKAYLSDHTYTERLPYGRDYDTFTKVASCCGCTNHEEFLRDATGDRRYLVFTMRSRDRDAFDQIDKEQLLAQAYSIYLGDFDYNFSREEIAEIVERNHEQFRARTTDELMLEDALVPSSEKNHSLQEIMWEVKEATGHDLKSNITNLGLYLKNMGIEKKRRKHRDKLDSNGKRATKVVYGCEFKRDIEEERDRISRKRNQQSIDRNRDEELWEDWPYPIPVLCPDEPETTPPGPTEPVEDEPDVSVDPSTDDGEDQ